MIFFNTGLSFTPKIRILCQNVWGPRGPGAMNFDIPSGVSRSTNLYNEL